MLQRTISRMFSVAIVFIAFGIIDNGIMVTSGATIYHFFGKLFSISAIASAGIGNTISGAIGIAIGRYTEKSLHKIFPPDEEKMSRSKIVLSEVIGIIIGCSIGMTPLIFF